MFVEKNRKSSYVGAYYHHKNDAVIIWERDETGVRKVVPYHAPYYFYTPSDDGEYTSIFGDKLIRHDFGCRADYEVALKKYAVRFESDFTPVQRVLMDEYYNSVIPTIHFAFLDIEVDYHSAAYDDNTVITVREKF